MHLLLILYYFLNTVFGKKPKAVRTYFLVKRREINLRSAADVAATSELFPKKELYQNATYIYKQ